MSPSDGIRVIPSTVAKPGTVVMIGWTAYVNPSDITTPQHIASLRVSAWLNKPPTADEVRANVVALEEMFRRACGEVRR